MCEVHSARVRSDTCFDHLLLNFDAKKSCEPAHEVRIVADECGSSVKQDVLVDEILREEIRQFKEFSVRGFVADVFLGAVEKAKFLLR
jgi:hypothetical protein